MMNLLRRLQAAVCVVVCVGLFASALGSPCIWDKDTLSDELRGLPDAFALVTGRWFTHGRAYYKQRLTTLPAKLKKDPDALSLYDDLAVAHERLRDRDAAIAVMEQKAAALVRAAKADNPAHHIQAYRYHANLGTFYAHSGRLAEAVVELEKAVALHKDAHFGRERFQMDLIRYVLAARQDPKLWEKHNFLTYSNYQLEKRSWQSIVCKNSFSTRIQRHKDRKRHRWTTLDGAYKAVVGMLRFGGLEGAELYRAAGDLFAVRRDLNLAWWSYQRALERGHPAGKQLTAAIASIEKHWREAKKAVGGRQVIPTPKLFRAVRAECAEWRRSFWAAEAAALKQGRDTGAPDVLKSLIQAADEAVPAKVFRAAAGSSAKSRIQSGAPPTNSAPKRG